MNQNNEYQKALEDMATAFDRVAKSTLEANKKLAKASIEFGKTMTEIKYALFRRGKKRIHENF